LIVATPARSRDSLATVLDTVPAGADGRLSEAVVTFVALVASDLGLLDARLVDHRLDFGADLAVDDVYYLLDLNLGFDLDLGFEFGFDFEQSRLRKNVTGTGAIDFDSTVRVAVDCSTLVDASDDTKRECATK